MKKFLSIMLSILMVVTTVPFAFAAEENVIDLSTLTGTYVISDSGEYTFTGSGSYGIKVESGNPTIVLNNASIMVGEGSSIDVASGSNVTIFVLGDNTIGTTKTESWYAPCGGIFVAEGGTVNITSNGTDNILRAHGTLAAAIGGKYDYDNHESYNAGSINISNVTVYAYTNNFYASAIGAAGEGTCGTINITNAVVYVYGAGDKWTSAPGIGNAWSLLDWSDTIPIVNISDSEVHTFRYNLYSDYIGYLGDESGDTYATGSINCGDGGSVTNSTIYCYTGLDATTTDKTVKYGALGGLLKEDGTCEGNCEGGTATCSVQAVCENCGTSYGELDPDNHDFGSGNTCICGAEIAFTGIVVDDENSDEYRYDETRKTYTIIIPADEVGGIGYLSYDIIGTNLTLIEDTNTLLKVQHENEDGLTPAPDDLLVDVLQDNGYFGWSVLGYGDGEWEKLLYSNDGGMTWTTYTFEVKQAYSITVNASQNGTVTANEYAIEGDNIALNVSPAEGYMLDTLSVTDASGNSVDVENNAFTMPASAVTVTATFAVCDHKDGRHETATDNGDGTHDATYSCCGTTVTEEHDFENDAHQCVCGKMETFTVSWFLSGSLMQSTSTYGQEFTQTFTVPENTHLRIDSVYLANDASVPVNYTYENGVLTIAATDVPAADVYIDCDHNVLVTFHANGGEIIPEEGYPQEGSTDIFPEDGSYWTQEWNYGSEICLSNCAAVCREGYTFVDWRDASGQVHQVIPGNGNYTLATEDMTLYAQWQCNHTIGGVVFRDNGNGTHNGYCGECDELLGNYVEHPHNFGDNTHKCVCGYACPHEWGEGVLTRPTFESEGYYTYTCTLCGHSYTEPAKEADTTALNDVSMKVTEYIDNDTLTQEAKDEIYKSYRDILKNNGNIFDEFGFVRGELVEEDQPAIDAITEELQKIIADADEKIESGEYVKADYTEIDEAIAKIEQKLTDENITDEGKAGLEEIKAQLEEMKADENTSEADVAELEKALEDYEEELDKGIEDGTLVEVDVDAIADDVNKKWAEKLEAEGLLDEYEDFINNQKATDEAMATVDEINDFANSLEGTVAENAENIAKLNEMLDSLLESWENCLRGTHNFKDYEITSHAKCEINAKETGTCWFCGETDEREIEGTALEHSFTKYEETEAPKCGVAGKEVAYCDNGCQTTDEREIPALEHIFLDYTSNGDATCTSDGTKTASCLNGCGATDTVADEGTKLSHTDEDGDKLCDDCQTEIIDTCPQCGRPVHEGQINEYICLLISIIRFVLLFIKVFI